MSSSFESRCKNLVADLGLGKVEDVRSVIPLTGGVASDIAMIELPGQRICVKFALAKLKVAEDWHAPTGRNKAEYEWLRVVASILPDNAPQMFGRSEVENGFAMEFLEGDQVYLWKSALLQAQQDKGESAKVGRVLGQIHSTSTAPDFDTSAFQNCDDFYSLRLEPYLGFTAIRAPDLAEPLNRLIDMLYSSRRVLVHGDVSPKNIMFRDGMPIFLDAECATMGDPSFDVAFCLNHLALKALHVSESRARLLRDMLRLWESYSSYVNWEAPAGLEARICALLPALMLARVDGKSPVEYLSEAECSLIRKVSAPLIVAPKTSLFQLIETLETHMKELNA